MALTDAPEHTQSTAAADDFGDAELDWGDEDEVLACGIENPEECEACQ